MGRNLINTNLRFNLNSEFATQNYDDLNCIVKIYRNDRKVQNLHYLGEKSIKLLDKRVMKKALEKAYDFEKGFVYRIEYYFYVDRNIKRRIYKPTNEFIETTRRDYLLRDIMTITI